MSTSPPPEDPRRDPPPAAWPAYEPPQAPPPAPAWGPPAGAQAAGAPPAWAGYAPQNSGKATASLVLGICGIVVCPIVLSIIGLVLGYQARNEIRGSGGRLTGEGNAKAGIVLGWVGLGIWALLIAVYVVIIVVAVGTDSTTFDTTSEF